MISLKKMQVYTRHQVTLQTFYCYRMHSDGLKRGEALRKNEMTLFQLFPFSFFLLDAPEAHMLIIIDNIINGKM